MRTSNGRFLFFVSFLKLNGSKQKGESGRKMCQSFTAERCPTKEALKTRQLFFATSVQDTVGSLKRRGGPQTTDYRKRSDPNPNPVQVARCEH